MTLNGLITQIQQKRTTTIRKHNILLCMLNRGTLHVHISLLAWHTQHDWRHENIQFFKPSHEVQYDLTKRAHGRCSFFSRVNLCQELYVLFLLASRDEAILRPHQESMTCHDTSLSTMQKSTTISFLNAEWDMARDNDSRVLPCLCLNIEYSRSITRQDSSCRVIK